MKYFAVFLSFFLLACSSQRYPTQEPVSNTPVIQETTEIPVIGAESTPLLFVAITIDQMKMDYLYRYWDDFSDDGFKRMVNEGTSCLNNHYSYAPTYTGPGHASIFTGTTPAVHGIIANDWYDRIEGMVYCASDDKRKGVGTDSGGGSMSPHRLLSTTISDELRLSNQFRNKVVALSMKDRGSILPAGGNPTGAYWFIGKNEGVFVTSDWYTKALPTWVEQFNQRNLAEAYVSKGWSLLRDPSVYDESYDDNNPYEQAFPGQLRAVFPYDFSSITENRYELIKGSPHGATISVDFAIAAIEGEQLGMDDYVDLLAISFSNTDYAGHQFGPQSIEVQDTYLRLDLELARLLDYLDQTIGKGKYSVFLTADHGGAPVPAYMKKMQMPGGYFKPQAMLDDVDLALAEAFGQGEWVRSYSNDQFFFNQALMADRNVGMEEICEVVQAVVLDQDQVYTCLAKEVFMEQDFDELPLRNIQRGIHPKLSGDLIVVPLPGYLDYGFQGTTHGSAFNYDTHVPLIFFGAGIPKGKQIVRTTNIRDIAPTVATLLRISQPTGTTGEPIFEIFE